MVSPETYIHLAHTNMRRILYTMIRILESSERLHFPEQEFLVRETMPMQAGSREAMPMQAGPRETMPLQAGPVL